MCLWKETYLHMRRDLWMGKERDLCTYEKRPLYIWKETFVQVSIYVNQSCDTYEWVMSRWWRSFWGVQLALHMWMSHVTHVNDSCHTCECVMSHMWMRHVTHVNESCHTCERVHHVTQINESRDTYECSVSRTWTRPSTGEETHHLPCTILSLSLAFSFFLLHKSPKEETIFCKKDL